MVSEPLLIVHGGAWDIPDDAVEACEQGCRRALAVGWEILAKGGSAVDAVEAAIVLLEDDPIFDAGIGSHLNRDGVVQLDAILMRGDTLKAGAVSAVERIRNPIRLARAVMERSEHMMLVGPGAELFAQENGLPLCDPSELVIEREVAAWRRFRAGLRSSQKSGGTVGAVARDGAGLLVAGTSTGGTCGKFPGRVGDSSLIGCGCYADNQAGAASSTGHGEAIMKMLMAKAATDEMARGQSAMEAARAAVASLTERTGDRAGIVLLGRRGKIGYAHTTSRMAFGYIGRDRAPSVFVRA
jgi:beta-aspartyl-peptidase (threonine type)